MYNKNDQVYKNENDGNKACTENNMENTTKHDSETIMIQSSSSSSSSTSSSLPSAPDDTNDAAINHHFCKYCGVTVWTDEYQGVMGRDLVCINIRCLDIWKDDGDDACEEGRELRGRKLRYVDGKSGKYEARDEPWP